MFNALDLQPQWTGGTVPPLPSGRFSILSPAARSGNETWLAGTSQGTNKFNAELLIVYAKIINNNLRYLSILWGNSPMSCWFSHWKRVNCPPTAESPGNITTGEFMTELDSPLPNKNPHGLRFQRSGFVKFYETHQSFLSCFIPDKIMDLGMSNIKTGKEESENWIG